MSEKPKKQILLWVVFLGFIFYFAIENFEKDDQTEGETEVSAIKKPMAKSESAKSSLKTRPALPEASPAGQNAQNLPSSPVGGKSNAPIQFKELTPPKTQEKNARAAKFKVEDGLVTVAGDIVLGVPKTNDFPNQGWIEPQEFGLWESAEIPFHIQPQFAHPERIYEAFELFKDSPIHFVPLIAEQADGLVFEEKAGTCKSYVGKIGGLQPVWIGAECSPANIAHEIMHALGFIHEQNRIDRDQYIQILWDNIKEDYKFNFELLPDFFMKVSGTSRFDFDSIMIYPSSSFAKSEGLITIKGKESRVIKPNFGLSALDLERLRKFYGQ